jgi:hypothetical protein
MFTIRNTVPKYNIEKNKIIYLLDKINEFDFYTLLYLEFPFCKGVMKNIQDTNYIISVNMIYQFDNFSPDFIIEIIEDGVVLYSEKSSIGSRPNEFNNLKFESFVNVHDINNLRVRLYKNDHTTNKILLNKLSYIQISLFE